MAFELSKGGVKAAAYHAELHPRERSKVQALWFGSDVHVREFANVDFYRNFFFFVGCRGDDCVRYGDR